MDQKHNFYGLTAHWAMSAIESLGLKPTGAYFKLNSYENRVFDLFLEKGQNPEDLNDHIIIKIYRPERWSKLALIEEQTFLDSLYEAGIPVIKNYSINNESVHEHKGLYFALYKKGVGRLPQELNLTNLKSIGRTLALIHNVGEKQKSVHRKALNTDDYGWPALENLSNWVSPESWNRYCQASEEILNFLDDQIDESQFFRIHGDCHRGNIIMTDSHVAETTQQPPFFMVDFDDFCMGPAVQDFWMLLSGPVSESKSELDNLISGYEEFRHFPDQQINLIEGLRGLRIIHYANWIAKRWKDPIFPSYFPQFREYIYWAEETEMLEKIAWNLNS